MAKWKLHSCPRCNGDLFIERDLDDWYEECLQCGYKKVLTVKLEVRKCEQQRRLQT
jgi:predicted  nucleic acid-binding Zn-ribbon protein